MVGRLMSHSGLLAKMMGLIRRFRFTALAFMILVPVLFAPAALAEEPAGELSWEMPGRLSIYDLQLGPAVKKDGDWKFLGNIRTFDAHQYEGRLVLMVRFSYYGSRSGIPLKFVIKLPQSRPYEQTVNLANRRGQYSYRFTIHNPEEFVGSGSVYLYYGFSIVDALDFTIRPGS
jgi:hypothetical protein